MPTKKQVKAQVVPNKKGTGIYQENVDNGKVDETSHVIALKEAGKISVAVVDLDPKHPEKEAFEVAEAKAPKDIKPQTAPVQEPTYKWIWQLLHGLPDFDETDANVGIGQQSAVSPLFPKVAEGGGIAWLEPFLPNEKPKNQIPNGYFISAKGTPKILSAEWREYKPTGDGKIITKTEQQLQNSVILDIYTEGLYGQEIIIELLADGDKLPLYEPEYTSPQAEAEAKAKQDEASRQNATQLQEIVITASRTPGPNGKNNQPQAEPETSEPASPDIVVKKPQVIGSVFRRQVSISKILQDETGRPANLQVSSSNMVVPIGQKKKGKKAQYQTATYVQKLSLFVFLDGRWFEKPEDRDVKIYPKVTIPSVKDDNTTTLKKAYLKIARQLSSQPNLPYSGNTPVLVGDVPTNPKRFALCKYNLIRIKDGKDEYVVFDESKPEKILGPVLVHEVIAGEGKAKQTISVNLEVVVTKDDDCTNNPKHKNHVIDIDELKKMGYVEEDEKSKRKNEKEGGLVKTEVKKTTTGPGKSSAESTSKSEGELFSNIVKHSDNEAVFDVAYVYKAFKDDGSVDWGRLWGYFWLPSVKTNSFTIKTATCRWNHDIKFIVYPDIKWSLVFGFNVEKDQLTSLFPGWCSDKTVKSFEKIGEKVQERIDKKLDKKLPPAMSQSDRDAINEGILDVYRNGRNKPEEKPKEDKPTKGKLSTLLEIMKKVDISLKTEWNGGAEKQDLTSEYVKSLFRSTKDIFELMHRAVEIIEGKHDQAENKAEGDEKIADYIKENEWNKRYSHLVEALKRPAQEVEILYPKFTVGGSWQYETVVANNKPELEGRKGLGIDLQIEAAPLIGIQITWHILDLLCRRHPVAYAVLAAVKGLLAALGDNPDGIKIDLWVKGKISGAIDFQHNLLAGFKEITAKSATSIQAGVEISILIKGVVIKGRYKAVAQLGFGAKAQVGMGTEDLYGVDDKGIFIQKKLIFEGIQLSFEGTASANVYKIKYDEDTKETKDEELTGIGGKIEGQITIGEHKFETNRIYLKKFDG